MTQKIQAKSLEELFQEAFGEGNLALAVRDIYGTWTEHPFAKGNLTTNGIQWSANVGAASTAANYVVISTATIKPFNLTSASIQEVEFGLTAAFWTTSTGTTGSTGYALTYKWEAKDADVSTWTIISTARAIANPSASTANRTLSGRFLPVANLNALPFHLRLRMASSGASVGIGKVKNSSYVRVKYKTPAV